jgi:hypothetical protein
MYGTGLDRHVWEGRVDGVREAIQAVYNGNQDIFHSPVFKIVHD